MTAGFVQTEVVSQMPGPGIHPDDIRMPAPSSSDLDVSATGEVVSSLRSCQLQALTAPCAARCREPAGWGSATHTRIAWPSPRASCAPRRLQCTKTMKIYESSSAWPAAYAAFAAAFVGAPASHAVYVLPSVSSAPEGVGNLYLSNPKLPEAEIAAAPQDLLMHRPKLTVKSTIRVMSTSELGACSLKLRH